MDNNFCPFALEPAGAGEGLGWGVAAGPVAEGCILQPGLSAA